LFVNFATTNFQSVAIGSSIWSGPRFAAFASGFYNIRIKSISIEPVAMPAATYLEYALMPAHLPALLSTYDAAPLAPSLTSSIMTLPGAVRAQQGNQMPARAYLKLPKTMEFQCVRINADAPPFAFLIGYGSNNTTFNLYFEVVFRGYLPFT
jgi:hypothetical protein